MQMTGIRTCKPSQLSAGQGTWWSWPVPREPWIVACRPWKASCEPAPRRAILQLPPKGALPSASGKPTRQMGDAETPPRADGCWRPWSRGSLRLCHCRTCGHGCFRSSVSLLCLPLTPLWRCGLCLPAPTCGRCLAGPTCGYCLPGPTCRHCLPVPTCGCLQPFFFTHKAPHLTIHAS